MMKNKLLWMLLLITQISLAQQRPRTELTGQIVSDSLSGANVTVKNKSAGLQTISDTNGMFYIKGREKDTLVFYSQSFDPKQLVLTETHFKMEVLRIPLDVFVNTLDEVVISPYNLTGDLAKDDANIKVITMPVVSVPAAIDQLFEMDEKSTPDNVAMPGYVDTRFMMNFGQLFEKLGKLIAGPPKPKNIIFTSDKIFPVAVQEKFSESFFLDTLKLAKDEIGLFLSFCETDPASKGLLEPRREIELIEFLMGKRDEFETFKK